jgi:hypothetical protein
VIAHPDLKIRVLDDNSGQAPASHRFMAYDDDRYDGADDGHTTAGFGPTRIAAIADLFERLEIEESA